MIPARTPATARLALATGLVVVAVLASMLALRSVVAPPWPAAGVLGVLLVGAALVVTRGIIGGRRARVAAAARAGATVSRLSADDGGTSSAWPTVVGAAVASWYLLARFGGLGGTTDWIVSPSSVGHLVDQLGLAGEIIRQEVAPVAGTPPIALLCVGGSLLVLLVADALAVGARHPLLASAAVLVLWFPPLVLTYQMPWTSFAVTVVALLLGLTLDGAPGGRRAVRDAVVGAQVRRAERRRAVRTTATAAGITAIALVASTAAAGVEGVGGGWTSLFTTASKAARLADNLDMYRSLSTRSGATVLTYTTSTGSDVGPLRLLTLSRFDGRKWDHGRPQGGDGFGPDEVLFPSGAELTAEPTRVELTVGSMREKELPVAVEPRSIADAGDGWRYVADRDEVVGDDTTQEGDTFTMLVRPRELSAEVLRAAPPGRSEVDDAFLDVPRTAHADDIAALARQIVGNAATDYDRAVALQAYLRSPSRFTYDPQVPPGQTGDAVWDFLQQRQGYCVQFATTMMVLARTLGIPARFAIGYLPGTGSGDPNTFTITGRDSHAWPELYFTGVGWVRFEPTPAVQTGAVPAYANPLLGGPGPTVAPTPEDELPRPGATGAAAAPSASPTTGTTAGPGEDDVTQRWLVGTVVLLVLAAGAAVLLLRRRGARPPRDAEEAWYRVVGALTRSGVTLPTATTPRRAPSETATAWEERTGAELPWPVRDGLTALAGELESERYAAPAEVGDEERAERLERLADLTRAVTTGLATAGKAAGRH
ncbi:transglutaminaseTgpA domain-containing protein [Xylanimonas protaetiae]|uniref:Transglutaminase domain-containing protein n=1 Tax=Xylanimonas protaetiae TaxID=2509457 RepID=A0A4P6F5I5_9MICO|nr:transglutaminase domain-containing protein [Xylanimonas protaetiae]QAY70625.1 transglutaminase domain-containing protein [Xylanimonas protaetiae]